MSTRTLLLLSVAVVAAGATAFYARSWLSAERATLIASRPAAPRAETPAVRILVAARDMAAGTFVKHADLTWQPWPEGGVAESYVVEGIRPAEDFVGAVVRTGTPAGQPITDGRLVHPGDRGFLAAVLEPGKRAVSVPVNATTGIAGFVFPGDVVDVILTVGFHGEGDDGKDRKRFFSETLLHGIRVLAVDQKVESGDGSAQPAKTATLEVMPKQVEKVAIALEMGGLSLSLHSLAREGTDEGAVVAVGAPMASPSYTMDMDVYYMRDTLRRRGGESRKTVVQVLRGGSSEQAAF